ncbi:hypothetical protein MKX69_14045 [Enterococcus sp. FSL R5-0957]|nr:hypothetical protein [Enterococcus faecium]MDB7580069.1 hypothetical protein [Enterococcus faecium]
MYQHLYTFRTNEKGGSHKKNMFALLGKPGFEDLAKELNERL